MLNMMSSSHTFSKYLSNVSTKLWMNSKKLNSFYIEFKLYVGLPYYIIVYIYPNNEE